MSGLRFASLGSGSQGNALLVEAGRTRILLDCGFGLAETRARLGRIGLSCEQIDGIVVTHEHQDHIGGVARIAKRFNVPVWITPGTLRGLEGLFEGLRVNLIENYAPFTIGDLSVEPFPVPHDAREPAQYVFGDGVRRLGVLTDTGCSTPHIEQMLSGCHGIVLETNHDPEMLRRSSYPARLKERISGRWGHLDNLAAGSLLADIDTGNLGCVVAAHLSQQNNTPELARGALSAALGCEPEWIRVADQAGGMDWMELK
ncbi:MAG: MBL fold metallo-hydrolase [Burkholderiales bacterium]